MSRFIHRGLDKKERLTCPMFLVFPTIEHVKGFMIMLVFQRYQHISVGCVQIVFRYLIVASC